MSTLKVGDRVRITESYPEEKPKGSPKYVGRTGTVTDLSPWPGSNYAARVRFGPGNTEVFYAEELEPDEPRVVFEVTPEPTIQIAFSDKPILMLTLAEARQVFRQLEELV